MYPSGVQFVVGLSGYFVKDLQAVRQSPTYDPLIDNICPQTPGFKSVVQAGQAISILIHLPDGTIAVGDCADVIFSGAASRDPLFIAEEHLPILESVVKPRLLACDVTQFRKNATIMDGPWPELQHARLHSAVRYGITQALLAATALTVSQRVQERGSPGYRPRLHFDVYGTIGDLFPHNETLVSFLGQLQRSAQPYDLLIESPIIESTQSEQIRRLANLRQLLRKRSIHVQIVADEWCNTLEDIRKFADAGAVDYVQIKMPDLGGVQNSIDAVLYCQDKGVGCCLGGSANETDVSARVTAHVALATKPGFLLSKPGIGADEGVMILTNEMLRASALAGRTRVNRL
ncbi:hypothetical protein AARAC_005225 [Aspergillus arachidicola]|uniref:Methylaspartate ammonia-lyase C-terminal domain-containing protein n=1 Tax=Aspergillus arachidicola TaxID=656916 RepID=A0A2G7EM51_9EURO|nr:hypothetical protein AARAC_005225 [Aspergillus arachidicola]